MLDKNGIEMRTGDIVKIENSYFKNDNGYFFVEHSPEDFGWSGNDYCLKKLNKNGTISKAKYNICFYPFMYFSNNRNEIAKAKEHNDAYATIQVVNTVNNENVIKYFKDKSEELNDMAERSKWYWGEDDSRVEMNLKGAKFYSQVAIRIS